MNFCRRIIPLKCEEVDIKYYLIMRETKNGNLKFYLVLQVALKNEIVN